MAAVFWVATGLVGFSVLSLLGRRFGLLRRAGGLAFYVLFIVLGIGAITKGNMLIAALEFSMFVILVSVYLWARLYAKKRISQTRNNE